MADNVRISTESGPSGSARVSTGSLISSFYLQIEYLLDRVAASTNHYQTLGIERSCKLDQVSEAYEKAVVVLQPPHQKVRDAMPDELRSRIGEAFAKVSEAFDVLSNEERRAVYDGSVVVNKRSFVRLQPLDLQWSKNNGSKPAEENVAPAATPIEEPPPEPDNSRTIDIRVFCEQERAFVKARNETGAKLRRCERFKLSIPALVTGYEPGGSKWKEVSKTIDVSRVGASVKIKRRMKHGVIVHVTLPLPTRLRSHGFTDPSYHTYAIVRRIRTPEPGIHEVGFEFLGASPPSDFLKKPWGTFKTQKWAGPDRRCEPRETRVERVEVEYLDAEQQVLSSEIGVTESISASGLRMRVKAAPPIFDWIRIKSKKVGFESIAELRNQYVGKDEIERLCVEFLEGKWPGMPTAESLLEYQLSEQDSQHKEEAP